MSGQPVYASPLYPLYPQVPGGTPPVKEGGGMSTGIWILVIVLLLLFFIILIAWGCWWASSSNSSSSGTCGVGSCGSSGQATGLILTPGEIPGGSGGSGGSDGGGSVPTSDILSDPENIEALPGLWMGSVDQSTDNCLYVPTYGYFYPRRVNGRLVRPIINTTTMNGNILYAHVTSPGLEGIYQVDTKANAPLWSLYIATGTNENDSNINAKSILDTNAMNSIRDVYYDSGRLYLVTEQSIYTCDGKKVFVADKTSGVLGGDSHDGVTVYLKDDDTILLDGKPVIISGYIPRRDVSSYVKYVQGSSHTFSIGSRDHRGHLGYILGPKSNQQSQIPSDMRAFGANKMGSFGFVDENGRVLINEYNEEDMNYRYKLGLPYKSTVPVDGFRVAVTVGGSTIFIFATLDGSTENCFSVVGTEHQNEGQSSGDFSITADVVPMNTQVSLNLSSNISSVENDSTDGLSLST